MRQAKIVNNKTYCPKHNKPLANESNSCEMVNIEGKNYIKFTRLCKECRDSYEYYLNLTTDEHFISD